MISVADIVSANAANTISINVICTKSINSDNKDIRQKMDCYILHTLSIVIMLLFMIAIIFYHYAKDYQYKNGN